MRTWIMTILFLAGRLESAAERLDEKAERIALDPKGNTMRQYEKIAEVLDVKRRLVNLRVMAHRLETCLNPSERERIGRAMDGASSAAVAESEGVSRTTAYRRTKRAFLRAAAILDGLGYDAARMEEDYASIPLCRRTYIRFRGVVCD